MPCHASGIDLGKKPLLAALAAAAGQIRMESSDVVSSWAVIEEIDMINQAATRLEEQAEIIIFVIITQGSAN